MLKQLFNRHTSLLLGLCLVLTACGPGGQSVKPSDDQLRLEAETAANDLIRAGDYSAAADEYLRLAEEDKAHTSLYQLKAAAASFEASEISRAQEILNAVQIDQLSESQLLQKNILLARVALHNGENEKAIKLLDLKPTENLPKSLLMAFYETRGQSFSKNGQQRLAIQERLHAASYTDPVLTNAINYDELWQDLNQLDILALEEMRLSAPSELASWLDLTLIAKKIITDSHNLQIAITDWQSIYPGHVANNSIVPNLINTSEQLHSAPGTVAILLPLSGKYRDASRAIREGLMAARYADMEDKPELRFYNADAMNVNQVYQLAINEGADFIIGPLEKEAVNNLINQGNPGKKTMALNYFEGDIRNQPETGLLPGINFFQFALSPEDEARQVAERAYFEGHHKALVISPNSLWGDRIFKAFQEHLEQLGGQVLERAALPSDTGEYSKSIIALLNTDISKERAKELRGVLNRKLESETRRRQDVDFIFLAAQPDSARQIVPHIHFQWASDVPVYASSHIYTSTPNPELDADMDNIQFADIPWILDPNTIYSDEKYTIEQNWPNSPSSIKRLFALGIDAYRLLANLSQLSSQRGSRMNGATGKLLINEQGQVQRQLTWAKFRNGIPEVIGEPF